MLTCASVGLSNGPLSLVPADALICWKGEPFPENADAPAAGQPSALATLIDAGTRIAGSPLRARQKFALRLVEAFGAATRRPFALVLLDAQARPTDDGDGKRVDKLQVALIVRTDGGNEPFLKIVQKAVNELTDQGQATLERRTAENWRYDELTDRRLSESIAWGVIGDYFVTAYGPGVWPRVAAAAAGREPSMAGDEWVRGVRQAAVERWRQGDGTGEPLIEVILDAKAVRQRLDPFVDGRASRFFQALDSLDLDRAHWALGFEGRGLYCTAHYREGGRTVRRVYADPRQPEGEAAALIPAEARYAVYRISLPTYLPRFFAGYYATRDEKERADARQFWERIQAELSFDGQKDLIEQFGDMIILHNDPPHPLRLPLAFTGVVRLGPDAQRVEKTLDSLLVAWQRHLRESEGGEDGGWTRLERDDDGVWYLQYGPIAGLAWTIRGNYLVTCWSPAALREALRKLPPEAAPTSRPLGP